MPLQLEVVQRLTRPYSPPVSKLVTNGVSSAEWIVDCSRLVMTYAFGEGLEQFGLGSDMIETLSSYYDKHVDDLVPSGVPMEPKLGIV